MLIKNDVNYKRLTDLEDENIASIWLKVTTSPNKTFIIGGYYRQWRLPQSTMILNSGSSKAQLERLNMFIKQY